MKQLKLKQPAHRFTYLFPLYHVATFTISAPIIPSFINVNTDISCLTVFKQTQTQICLLDFSGIDFTV